MEEKEREGEKKKKEERGMQARKERKKSTIGFEETDRKCGGGGNGSVPSLLL